MSSNRRQSFVATPGLDVQYEGSKSFWKTRNNVDLLIVSHPRFNCLEIVAFEPEKGFEAPRIYVNAALLLTKLDPNEIKLRVEEKKEASIRQKKPVDAAKLQKEMTVNAMNQFITSRLHISDDVSCAANFRIFLTPMGDDKLNENTKELDVIMDPPKGLTPLPTCFQKKVTVNDIKSALSQLEIENAELKRATRLAELATSSVDGFKLMLAEKMRLETEMKKKFSIARLRWIKAINRVLIQNYVAKVRIRLGMEEVPAPSPSERVRPKMLRHSIDNSHLHSKQSGLPNINKPSPVSVTSTHHHATGSLPVLSPTHSEHNTIEKRKRRTGKNGKMLQRKSYDGLPSAESKSDRISLACPSSESVPSLLESYNSVSQRMVPNVSVPVLADIREHSTRALRLARL